LSADRGANDTVTITVSRDTLFVYLQAPVSREESDYRDYRLLITDRTPKVLVRQDRPQRADDGTFHLLVARDQLPPGTYTLRIFGVQDAQTTLIFSQTFRWAIR